MTATADPTAPVEGPARAALDRAEGIELLGDLHGSGYRAGAALVRRADGQVVQVGPLMYALLECVDGRRDAPELAACLSERVGRRLDETQVARLAEKLAAQGLLAGTEHNAPPRRNPLLGLRWKVLVTNPAVTSRLTAPFTVLFRRWLVWPLLVGFAAVFAFVLFEKGIASATSQAFANPELLLLVVVLTIASAGFHELGHAAACRFGGARPGGMGMGLYMVWPAFYTDVTDAYRLQRGDRLRVDLGGLYFNAIVAVVTVGLWLAWRADALLLLVALQAVQMVKQLSPVVRADGYHILSDLTGVPDLYAHIGPTLRRLLPWRRHEPSALTGRARLVVTLWVLVVVPVLLSLALGAVLLLPRLLATAWASASAIGSNVPEQVEDGSVAGLGLSALRLLSLLLPTLGAIVFTHGLARMTVRRARGWSDGSPARQGLLTAAAAGAAALAVWTWWPSGQYEPIRASDEGTLISLARTVTAPRQTVRPSAADGPVELEPGTHLAVAMIPVEGPTEERPALFVIRGEGAELPVAIVAASLDEVAVAEAEPPATETMPAETGSTTTAEEPAPDEPPAAAPIEAVALPFRLPAPPGPGDTQAVAVGTKDGAVAYTVAYALVTVSGGAPVTSKNSAFALASCKACTTVAVSFQLVLVIGRSAVVAPINAAGALNVDCPACVTAAIANQLVVTLTAQPSEELVARLNAALEELEELPELGTNAAALAAEVAEVQEELAEELEESGLLARPDGTTTPATTTTAPTVTTAPPAASTTEATTTAPPAASTTPATTTAPPTQTSTAPPATTSEPATTTAEPEPPPPTATTTTTTGEAPPEPEPDRGTTSSGTTTTSG